MTQGQGLEMPNNRTTQAFGRKAAGASRFDLGNGCFIYGPNWETVLETIHGLSNWTQRGNALVNPAATNGTTGGQPARRRRISAETREKLAAAGRKAHKTRRANEAKRAMTAGGGGS